MAKIVITKVGNNGVYVDFGEYESEELKSPQGFNSLKIEHIEPSGSGIVVKTSGRDTQTWPVSWEDTAGFMTVTSIDSVAPTSTNDLILKLTALM